MQKTLMEKSETCISACGATIDSINRVDKLGENNQIYISAIFTE